MAVPIYQRNELPPGQTGQVKPPFQLADRSSEQRFAEVATGFAGKMWQDAIETQAGLEYTDFIGTTKAAEAEFEKYVQQNPNETIDTYRQQQDKMMGNIKKAGEGAKTGLAKQKIRQFYNANKKLIREQSEASALAVVRSYQLRVFNEGIKADVDAGNIESVTQKHSEYGEKLLGKEVNDITFKNDRNLAMYHRAQNDISAKQGEGFKPENYPGLDPPQIISLREYAHGVKGFNENQRAELTEKQIQAIHELAIKNVAPDIVKAKIDQSDALTPAQKTEAWKQHNEALSVRAKTGQNPYTTTQDWNSAMEAYWKAEQGIVPDSKDVGSKYDVQWYEKIKKIAEGGGTTADFEDSSAAKFLKELIDDFGRRYTLYDQVPVMREKAFRLLQDGIQGAKIPLTDREKKELALRIFNNLQTEPITSAPGALLTPTEKAEELGQSLDKAVAENIAYQKTQGKSATIPQPKSQAEFDALPKGTRYRRSDGSIWTKR